MAAQWRQYMVKRAFNAVHACFGTVIEPATCNAAERCLAYAWSRLCVQEGDIYVKTATGNEKGWSESVGFKHS